LNYINLNGKITTASEAHLPIDNGAFRYGYGLFETMLVQDGLICLEAYHWDRLFSGMKQLYFDIPYLMTPDWLAGEVLRTVSKNKLEALCRVRLQMFAGGGGLYSAGSNAPGYVIECFPLDPENMVLNTNGLTVGIAAGLNKSMDSLADLKSCNALIYAMAAKQAKEHKWNDALICNTHGNIIESTIANIFWIKDGTIYTPPLSDGCIAGVMRRHIMKENNIIAKLLHVEDLLDADEAFLTNAIKRIRWIGSLGDKTFSNNQISSIRIAPFS
jgi:branched-chain amino acid aminotransferase